METIGSDAVDVLCFHDYSPTRAAIRTNIERAKQFAAKAGKQLMNSEIGCVARANAATRGRGRRSPWTRWISRARYRWVTWRSF